jgi:hypothetical protein
LNIVGVGGWERFHFFLSDISSTLVQVSVVRKFIVTHTIICNSNIPRFITIDDLQQSLKVERRSSRGEMPLCRNSHREEISECGTMVN